MRNSQEKADACDAEQNNSAELLWDVQDQQSKGLFLTVSLCHSDRVKGQAVFQRGVGTVVAALGLEEAAFTSVVQLTPSIRRLLVIYSVLVKV